MHQIEGLLQKWTQAERGTHHTDRPVEHPSAEVHRLFEASGVEMGPFESVWDHREISGNVSVVLTRLLYLSDGPFHR
jgi:hypothetical protein